MPPSARITYPTALVLLGLREGLIHGFDIIDATGLRSGTVYPILRRLEDAGSSVRAGSALPSPDRRADRRVATIS